MRSARIGLFGIGLEAYWPQFDGLKRRLEGYVNVVADRIRRPGIEVVNLGLIDTPPKALDAGHRFRREDVDLIFLYRPMHITPAQPICLQILPGFGGETELQASSA